MQNQLSKLSQQVVHGIHACNGSKVMMENVLDSGRVSIDTLVTPLKAERSGVASVVSGVRTQMQLHRALLQPEYTGSSNRRTQVNELKIEAYAMLQGVDADFQSIHKRILVNMLQIISIQALTDKIKENMQD